MQPRMITMVTQISKLHRSLMSCMQNAQKPLPYGSRSFMTSFLHHHSWSLLADQHQRQTALNTLLML